MICKLLKTFFQDKELSLELICIHIDHLQFFVKCDVSFFLTLTKKYMQYNVTDQGATTPTHPEPAKHRENKPA